MDTETKIKELEERIVALEQDLRQLRKELSKVRIVKHDQLIKAIGWPLKETPIIPIVYPKP